MKVQAQRRLRIERLLAPAALLGLWLAAASATAGEARPEMVLDLGDGVTLKLVQIPAGKFLMGSPADEKGRWPEEGVAPADVKDGKTQVEVTISKPFYMGVYEVTREQFQQFVKDDNRPTGGGMYGNANKAKPAPGKEKHPVISIKMDDALAFCEWLSQKTGKTVLLPTEAQWEYACRARTTTRFSYGDKDEELCLHGNYCDKNSPPKYEKLPWQDKEHDDGFAETAPVGSYKPNAWGLYDMHGNVWELCRGLYEPDYSARATVDPPGSTRKDVVPPNGSFLKDAYYVFRGGSYICAPADCRSASREHRDTWREPHNQWVTDGFRVIVEDGTPEAAAQGAVGQELGKRPAPATDMLPATRPLPYKIVKLPELVLDLGDGVSMKFLKVPPGKWTPPKGGEAVEVGTFYLAVYEVTVDQFNTSKLGSHPPPYPQSGQHPITGVGGVTDFKFCSWMSEKTGKLVRLPTLAEWQHAVRAGTTTKYYFGDGTSEMYKYANGCDRACSRPLPQRDMRYWDGFDKNAPVGSFPPNPWGFYDMMGNVVEMTSNIWPMRALNKGEPQTSFLCGGDWHEFPGTYFQGSWGPNNFWQEHAYDFFGFRVAVSIDPKTGEAALAPGDAKTTP